MFPRRGTTFFAQKGGAILGSNMIPRRLEQSGEPEGYSHLGGQIWFPED